jgi:hypothetical protein
MRVYRLEVRRWITPPLVFAAFLLGACGDSITGPQGVSCGLGPYLSVLPVPEVDIVSVAIFGGMDAPGHVLPTPHGGLFSDRANVPLRSPGDLAVTRLRRVRSTGPTVPLGAEDYAIFFQVCNDVSGWFGHVVTLSPTFSPETVQYTDCETYSVPHADIESCEASGLDIKVSAGDALGTFDFVIDMGMTDERVTNFYVSPERFGGPSHAVCMWEQFDAGLQAVLFSKLRDGVRPHLVPTGEPRCGTMAVDVAGSAKGVWAEVGAGPIGGDERRYIALADYPYRPQQELVLSLGPEGLGARPAIVPQAGSGRINVPFEQVTPDGLIYCYGPEVDPPSTDSWLLRLTSDTELTIEWRSHGTGPSPCEDDSDTWVFSGAAVAMVR